MRTHASCGAPCTDSLALLLVQDKATQEALILRSMHHPNLLPILTCFLAGAPKLVSGLARTSAGPGCTADKPPRSQRPASSQGGEPATFAIANGSHADDTAFGAPAQHNGVAEVQTAPPWRTQPGNAVTLVQQPPHACVGREGTRRGARHRRSRRAADLAATRRL